MVPVQQNVTLEIGLLKSNKVPIVGKVHELARSDNVATTQRSQLIAKAQQIKQDSIILQKQQKKFKAPTLTNSKAKKEQ